MEVFEAGDRVVAIDTDMSRMIHPPRHEKGPEFHYPDGVLQKDVVYHVAAVKWTAGGQGLYITGLRSVYGSHEIPWGAVRFRKVDSQKGHVPLKEEDPMDAPGKKTMPLANTLVTQKSIVSG